jgi:transcriptional regulator with XRE-family HTH domain
MREKIRTRIKELKTSIPEVSRKAGFNQVTLYNYLAGRSEITAAKLEKVLEILKIELKVKR